MTSITQDAKKFGFLFDKTTQTYLDLPYTKEQVLIAPNDFVSAELINKKFYYLHYNFLFLYKLCIFGNFTVPSVQNFSFSASDKIFYEELSKTYIETENIKLQQSPKCAISYFLPEQNGTLLFYTSKTELFSLIYDQYKISTLTKTSFIDPLSGSIVFRNITEIKTNKKGDLYIVDNDYKNLLYYDINPVLKSENIYRNLPFLKNVVGGEGTAEEKSKFNNINNIGVNDNLVLVEDNINKCFKLFDRFLNWLDTTKFISIFNEIKAFNAIALSEENEIFAVANQQLFVFNIEKNYNIILKKKYSINTYIQKEERVLNIKFSNNEPKTFFIFTETGIKKAWSTDPTGCIGSFNSPNKIIFGDVFVNSANGKDNIIVKTEAPLDPLTFKLNGYQDQLKLDSLLVNPDFSIFGYDELLFKRQEYVTNWVFQKAFKKIFYNHITFLKEVKYRLLEENSGDVSVIVDRLYNQLFLNYTQPYQDPVNLNIGVNELFQAEVINRAITEIYNQQITILLFVVDNVKTKQYFSPDPTRLTKNAVTFTYFSDESINLFPQPAKLRTLEELAPGDGIILSLGGAPYQQGDGISIIPGTET